MDLRANRYTKMQFLKMHKYIIMKIGALNG
jgi:hypothetical protein